MEHILELQENHISDSKIIGLGIGTNTNPRVRSRTHTLNSSSHSSDFQNQISFEPQIRLASFKFGRRQESESGVQDQANNLAAPLTASKDVSHGRSKSVTKSISFSKLFGIKKKPSPPLNGIESSPPFTATSMNLSQPPPRIESPVQDQSSFSIPLLFQSHPSVIPNDVNQYKSHSQSQVMTGLGVIRKARISHESRPENGRRSNDQSSNRRTSDGSPLSCNYGFVDGSSESSHNQSTPFLSPTSNVFSLERGPSSLGHEFTERRGSEAETNATSEGRPSLEHGKLSINEEESFCENATLPPLPPQSSSQLETDLKLREEDRSEMQDNWADLKKDFKRNSNHRRSKTFDGGNLMIISSSSNKVSHSRSISNTSVGSFTRNWKQRPTSIDLTSGGPISTYDLNDEFRFPNFDSKMCKFLPTAIASEESKAESGSGGGIFKRPMSRSGSSNTSSGGIKGESRSRSSTFSSVASKVQVKSKGSQTFEKLWLKLKPLTAEGTSQNKSKLKGAKQVKKSGSFANLLSRGKGRGKVPSKKIGQTQDREISSTSSSTSTQSSPLGVGKALDAFSKLPAPARNVGGRRFASSRSGFSSRSGSGASKSSAHLESLKSKNEEKEGLKFRIEDNQDESSEPDSDQAHMDIELTDSDIDSSFQNFFRNAQTHMAENPDVGRDSRDQDDEEKEEAEEVVKGGEESEVDHDGDDELEEADSSFANEQTPRAKIKSKGLTLQSPASIKRSGQPKGRVLKNQESESSLVLIPETPRRGINGNLASNRSRLHSKEMGQTKSFNLNHNHDTSLAFEISHEFEDCQDSISVSESESEGDERFGMELADQDSSGLHSGKSVSPIETMGNFSSLTGRSPSLFQKRRTSQEITWRNSASLNINNLGSETRCENPDVPHSIHGTSTFSGSSENEGVRCKEERRGSSISFKSGASNVRFGDGQNLNEDQEDIALENWDGRSTASSISVASVRRAWSPWVSPQSSPVKGRRNSVGIPLQHLLLMKDSPAEKRKNHPQRAKTVSQASTSTSFPFTLTLCPGSKRVSSAKLSLLKNRQSSKLSTLFDPFDSCSLPDQKVSKEEDQDEKIDLEELERLSRLAELSWENFNSTVILDEDDSLESEPVMDSVVSTFPASSTTNSAFDQQRKSRGSAIGMNFQPSCDFSLIGAVLGLASSNPVNPETLCKSTSEEILGPSSTSSSSSTSPTNSTFAQFKATGLQSHGTASIHKFPNSRVTSISKSLLSFVEPPTSPGSTSGNEDWIEDWGNSPMGLSLDTNAVGTPTKFEDLVGQFQKRTASEQKRLKKWNSGEALSCVVPSSSPSSRHSSGLSRSISPLLSSPKATQLSSLPSSPLPSKSGNDMAATEAQKRAGSKMSLADFLEGLKAPFDPAFPPVRPTASRNPRRSRTTKSKTSPQPAASPTFPSPAIGLGLISSVNSNGVSQRCTSPSPLRRSLDEDSIPKEILHPHSSIQRAKIGRTPKSHPLPHRSQFEFSPELDPPQDDGLCSVASSACNSYDFKREGLLPSEGLDTISSSDSDLAFDGPRASEWQRFTLLRLGASLSNAPLENDLYSTSSEIMSSISSTSFSAEILAKSNLVPGFGHPQNFVQHRHNSITLFSLSSTLEEDEALSKEPQENGWNPNGTSPKDSILVSPSPSLSPALIRSNKISQEKKRNSGGSKVSIDDVRLGKTNLPEMLKNEIAVRDQRTLSSQIRDAKDQAGDSYGGSGVFEIDQDETSQDRSYDFEISSLADVSSGWKRNSIEQRSLDEGEWDGDGDGDGDSERQDSRGDTSNQLEEDDTSISFSLSVASDFDLCQHLFQRARFSRWEKLQREQEQQRERDGEGA